MFDLQAALDTGNAIIGVRPGVHQIAKTVVWPRYPVTLYGFGIGISVLEVAANISIGIQIIGTIAQPIPNVTIIDLTIRGATRDSTAPRELIEINDYVSNVTLRSVELAWCIKSGLRFSAMVFGSGLLIQNCRIHDIGTAETGSLNGGAIQGCLHNSRFVDCDFENTGNSDFHHALYLTTSSTTPIVDVAIHGCRFVGATTRLSIFGGTYQRLRVTDNAFTANITHFYSCDGALISNNLFIDNVPKLASKSILFCGNQIMRIAQAFEGVSLEGAPEKVTISGNRIESQITKIAAVSVYVGSGHTISGNTFVNTLGIKAYNGATYSEQGNNNEP